ncbi:hypothetical protein SALBM135S_01895 [Streptomyces alboniger]
MNGAAVPREKGLAGRELMGRDAQLAAVHRALADITRTGSSLLLRGDPGMGKTALLRVAGAAARDAGLRVLRMTGAEAESGLPFAALHQVLWPLLDEAGALSAEQRHALESALGVREGTPPEGFTVAGAALTLLAHAAGRRPVAVLLDDLQYADPSSVAVFGYVRRRLRPLRVVAIGATRCPGATAGRAPEGEAGPALELRPLDEPQAEALLRALHPTLPEGLRHRVLRAAGGNPLALEELPARLRRAARGGPELPGGDTPLRPFGELPLSELLLSELPLGERLGRLYEDRLRPLPDTTRRLLLAAALGGPTVQNRTALRDLAAGGPGGRGDAPGSADGDHAPGSGAGAGATRRSAGGGEAGAAWARAREGIESSGLARFEPGSGRLVFRHPLVRASLTHTATPAERRAAHRLLADALPAGSPRRTLHLAAAALGTDAELAALLHAQADGMAAQGGDAEAAVLMARAARLSPDPPGRVTRLVTAGAMAVRSGSPRLAAELLAEAETEARPVRPEPAAAYAFALACTRLQLDADPGPAVELLPGALDALTSTEGAERRAELFEPALFLLLVAAVLTGDQRAWAAAGRHAHASPAAALCREAWVGPRDAVHQVPMRLREMVAALPRDRETPAAWLLLWAAAAVGAIGEHDVLRNAFARRHACATQTFLDSLRAHDDFLHGRWDASLTASREGARVAADHGYALAESLFLRNVAEVAAARGDRAALAELEPVLGTTARERGLRLVTERLRGLRILCALGHGRADEAWHHARLLAEPGAVPASSPWAHLSLVDWVQAAVESGHRAEAAHHLRAVRAAGSARASAHHTFLVAVAEALAADDRDAERRYRAVYALPDAEHRPFPLARARLAHGAWLRRRHEHARAAALCGAALAAFTRLGATPWAARASRELDGLPTARTAPDGHATARHPALSAQESRIAELVAQGLTNRQVAERLDLSPRTVGAHLYRIFPKLGITTRAGVARALEGTGD